VWHVYPKCFMNCFLFTHTLTHSRKLPYRAYHPSMKNICLTIRSNGNSVFAHGHVDRKGLSKKWKMKTHAKNIFNIKFNSRFQQATGANETLV